MFHPETLDEVCNTQGWSRDGNDVTVALAAGRRQVVHIEGMLFEGEEMVRLLTRVGSVTLLSNTQLEAVLSLNFSLPLGALAAFGDDLVMTNTVFLREAQADQLATNIRFLAETADRYERDIFGTDRH